MMEINDDKLLKDFFAKGKKEITDDGFSQMVMHQLPDRKNRMIEYIANFIMLICLVLFFAFNGVQAVLDTLKEALIGMIQQGTTSGIDPKSIIIAGVVLLFMATRKICSME